MVGRKVVLQIKKMLSFGVILGDEEILLPSKFVPSGSMLGDLLEVFIYTDSEDRIVATTLEPYGFLGEIVFLEVVGESPFGVFLDLGIPKDILMPQASFQQGQKVAVQLTLDRQKRLLATPYLKFQRYQGSPYAKLNASIYRQTPLGFECIVEKKYSGMLFHNEIFQPVVVGESYEVEIKKVRYDGKLDLKLVQVNEAQKLVETLVQAGGKLPITSKSDPREIVSYCQMSKKAFKRALTHLAQEIRQDEKGIILRKMEPKQLLQSLEERCKQ